jgi:hypothetical protein
MDIMDKVIENPDDSNNRVAVNAEYIAIIEEFGNDELEEVKEPSMASTAATTAHHSTFNTQRETFEMDGGLS